MKDLNQANQDLELKPREDLVAQYETMGFMDHADLVAAATLCREALLLTLHDSRLPQGFQDIKAAYRSLRRRVKSGDILSSATYYVPKTDQGLRTGSAIFQRNLTRMRGEPSKVTLPLCPNEVIRWELAGKGQGAATENPFHLS